MYRIQLSGNDYKPNKEIGAHYQIHRGLGIHHTKALARGEDLPVTIFVEDLQPIRCCRHALPENMSELIFAGMLAVDVSLPPTGAHGHRQTQTLTLLGYVATTL